MNNIYRVIWNACTNVWQAVSEIGRSGGKTQSVRKGAGACGQGALRSFAATSVMMACAMAHAQGVSPTLPVLTTDSAKTPAVNASVATAGNVMTVTQTAAKAVLNWESFNVGADKTVSFAQPDAASIALNRVIGVNAGSLMISRSLIEGKITANGQIFLINPAGITFAKGAQVDVGGIVASTRNISDEDFNAGKFLFKVDEGEAGTMASVAEIRNEGKIKAGSDGYVVMIAAKIVNAVNVSDKDTPLADKGGKITAKNVMLAAGDEVLLQLAEGVPAITVNKGIMDALIENGGWITAQGGRVLLTAVAHEALIKSAINNSGVIEAGSISMVGDVITLDVAKVPKNEASDGNSYKLDKSQLIATGPKVEGVASIELTGGTITLASGNELIANHTSDASIKLSTAADLSNAGSIITGAEGASGTVDLKASGNIKNAASGLVKSGAITLDGTTIKLEADVTDPDAIVKSQLIASAGPIELKALGAMSNDGLIQSGSSISLSGDLIDLGKNSQLLATNAAASIQVTSANLDLKNAGSIITGEDGQSGTVTMFAGMGSTPSAGSIENAATGVVKSGTITLRANKDITLTDNSQLIARQGSVSLSALGDASINGLVQSTSGVSEAADITVNAANITLKSKAVLDASGNVAGAVTTNAAFKLNAEDGAQVKTLSSSDSSQLGTWTARAADVHVRTVVVTVAPDPNDATKTITTTGPTGVDLSASTAGTTGTPGVLVTRVNLLDKDQKVNATDLVGDFSKIQKAAKANGTDLTTELTKQGWNIVVDEAMEKPAASIVTADGPLKGQSLPQDVTLTLQSGRDITINEKINSGYGRGRLNLVLDALGDVVIGEKGNITTNSGNVYVGNFKPAGATPWPTSITDVDKVDAKGHDFVMQAGAKLDVGGGSLVVNVDNDIKLGSGSTIYKFGQTGLRNVFKKTVVNGQWDYSFTPGFWYETPSTISLTAAKDITVAGNITANSTTLNMTAGQNIVAADSGKILQNGYGTVANIVADGDIGAASNALRVDADVSAQSYLKVTNTKGSSYIRNDLGYYNNIVLKTTETTDGVQSIDMKGDLQVLAMATAKQKDINDNDVPAVLSIEKGGVLLTGGVAGQLPGNLEIRAPNILLTSGSIKSTDGSTVPGGDPSLQVPRGSSVMLIAQSNDEPSGYIRSSTPADAKTDGPDIDVATGTVSLNAKNIGTESAGSEDAVNFKQALEVKTTSLRVANAGGDTWLSNSAYNTLSFTMDDNYGTAEGRHHILSSNGDFFNVESTKDRQLVVYSIDRAALSTSPSPSSTQGRMSGIYTRSDEKANKNLDLSSAIYGKARDLIFMDDAVDVGSATLTLSAYSGASALGYSDKLVQDNAKRFGEADHAKKYIDGTNKDTPHLTMGNLNLSMALGGAQAGSLGGGGYDLKVKKGGAANQLNAETNTLNISTFSSVKSGDVALHELSAAHFKDITISDDRPNTAHAVNLNLYHNNGVKEQLNYTDDGSSLKFDKTSAALSGYNRNFRLYVKNKDVEIGGFGTADGKVTSGDFTVYADNIALKGDITTTHRANENAGFDRGNVSLTANTYTLLSDTQIDTNTKDAEGADASKPGNIDLASRSSSYASNIVGNNFSLNVNAKSSDPLVGGGNINADVFTTGLGSDGTYLKNLSFTTNSVDNKSGQVSITGSKFWLTGDFKASGAVSMSGNQTTNSNTDSDFSIRTNKEGTGDSGSITFDGTSFTLNKRYGHALFDTSSVTGAAGNVTLLDSAADSKHISSLTVGSLSVNAEGSTANGNISVENVTTTGLSDSSSRTYSYAAQSYVADKVTLGGDLITKSGDVTVDAKKEVVIANDVKIQTFNGNTDLSDSKNKMGIAGDVTLGATGAKLVATGQTLEIDASAGRSRSWGDSSYIADHGLITMNASASGATEFKNLTLIGSTVEGDFATSKFSTTGQMTLGLLDQATSKWTGIKAGSLLLLGENKTDYTFTDAEIGTLAANATGALKVTSIKPLTVGTLSYSGTFGTTANGISIGDGKEIGGSVELSAGAITVAANSQVVTPVGEIKLISSDSATGGITLAAGSLVSANDLVTLKTASTGITMGANTIVEGSAGVSLTADTGDIALGEKVTVLASGSGDVSSGDVILTATKGAITTGSSSSVASIVGMTAIQAGTGITLGGNTTVNGETGVSLTADTGDITLGEKVEVKASRFSDAAPVGDVAMIATAGAIKIDAGSQVIAYQGATSFESKGVGTKGGISIGKDVYVYGKDDVNLKTQFGQIKIAEDGTKGLIHSYQGSITIAVGGEGSIDVAAGNTLLVGRDSVSKISTGTGDITFAGRAYYAEGVGKDVWLDISAGSSKKKGDDTGGNVIFTGKIDSNAGNRAVIYTGSADKAEEKPDSYISHYTLGSYVYGADATSDLSNVPTAPVVVAFRQNAGNLSLSIPSEKVYSGKTWVNQVADDAVATQEQLALDVSGLRKWESAYVDANRGPASAYDYLAQNKWIPRSYSLKSDSGELKNVGDYKVKFVKDPTAPEVTNPVGYGVSAPGGSDATVDFKITPKELTVNVQASKTYDGNDVATLDKASYSLTGFVMNESATVSKTTGSFNSKNVEEANSVTTTLTAADFTPDADSGFLATNYSYSVVAGQGTIAAKKLGAVALNPANTFKKVYDGNSTANLTGLLDFSFTGLVAGESMSVVNGLGQFGSYRDGFFVASKNVSDVNLVQVLMSNPTYTMGAGTLASNYLLPSVIQSEMKGQITPRQLLATAKAEDKLFDGKVDAKAVISLVKPDKGTGVVGNDQVSLGFRSAEFVDSQVGVNKQVFLRDPFAQGADSDNYVVSFDGEFPAKDVTTQASIRPLNLSPVVMAPPAPVPVVIAPPNFSNGPVQSIGGMGVVNVESSSQSIASADDAGGMTAVTIESLLANQAGAPNQVYVVDGGIKFEKSDK